MRRIVMGTAGHIDHGKTSLVKTLTGYDTDRLKEEKARGITIALGFVSLKSAGGDEIAIIDVPGHEKFIRTMISGAQGLDMIMLVIAADDGVMPQTREHLDICSLLGIKHGIIAITKSDLVDDDWLELVRADIAKFVSGTFLEHAPVVEVSSVTGAGIDTLRTTIESTAKDVVEREVSGLARMPVDRVFTMKGFGTVITGTLISGELTVGDEVSLLPGGRGSKIRGLEQHGSKVDKVLAGNRVAVNLASFEKDESIRGELLTRKGTFVSSHIYDVEIRNVSADKIAIKNLSSIRFLAHTSHAHAEIRLLSGKKIAPGAAGYAQIRLTKPMPLAVDDRFILLGTSKVQTLGGGTVLNIPERLCPKKRQAALEETLTLLKNSDSATRAVTFIKRAALSGLTLKRISQMLNLKEKLLMKSLGKALSTSEIVKYDSDNASFVSSESFTAAKELILSTLKGFHEKHRAKPGMVKAELTNKTASLMHERLYLYALKSLISEGAIVSSAELVLLKGHESDAAGTRVKIQEAIIGIYQESSLTPPPLNELIKRLSEHDPRHVEDTFNALIRERTLIRISEGYYLHESAFSRLTDELIGYFKENDTIDAAAFKLITNVSRKYSIPLLEKFDMLGITIRQPDNTRIPGRHDKKVT